MTRSPTLLNVFAGAGGLALGFEQAGFRVVAAVESDPVHAATFQRNFPSTKVLCGAIAFDSICDRVPSERFDVIAGSLPSSAFSVGGRRDPGDDRRRLLDEFVEIVAEVQPLAFALEAVPGILSVANGPQVQQALGRLTTAGYSTPQIWHLNAADLGLPQTRKRVWVVGVKAGIQAPDTPIATVVPVLRRPVGLPVFPRDGRPVGPTVWNAIGDLPEPSEYVELRTSDRMVWPDGRAPASDWAKSLRADRTIGYARARRVNPQLLTASQATEHTWSASLRFAQTAPGSAEPISRFYRLHPDGLARTLRAGTSRDRGSFTGSRPLHPYQPRVVTVREGARLQGFPDWFGFNATKWHGFHQVGSAAPPPVARAVADRLLQALRVVPVTPIGPPEVPDESLLFLDLTRAARRMGATSVPIPRRRSGLRPRPPRAVAAPPPQLVLPVDDTIAAGDSSSGV